MTSGTNERNAKLGQGGLKGSHDLSWNCGTLPYVGNGWS